MPQKMHLDTIPKSVPLRFQTLSAAVLSALLIANASAAGLGKLTVNSALGQPLRAEIELTSVTNDEAGSLAPKLASSDAFRQANIDFNPALYSLRFALGKHDDGKQYISVTSTQPINDPFVDMLIELGGNGTGRLVREYTFLLDPVDLHAGQAPEVVAARSPALARNTQEATPTRAPQTAPAANERPVQSARASRTPQDRSARPNAGQRPESEKNAPQQGNYHVKSGDSLSKIAGRLKPEGISLDQMLVALFRNNQGAFAGNNMNRLRAGQVLSVPDASGAGSVNNSEAKGIVVAQAADFNDYRNKLASQVVNAEAQKSSEARQSASGKITTKVEEKPTVAAESKDKLKLSKAGAIPSEKPGKIVSGEEEKIAKDKAVAEANARVKELEKNVSDLQKILEVKNKNIADQQKADAARSAAPIAAISPAAPVAAPIEAPKPAEAPAIAANRAPEAKTDTAVAIAPRSVPPKPKARPIPPPETSFMDDLLGSPFTWGGAAALLVATGAFGIYSGYRRRKQKSFGDSIITDSSLKANSLFGSTGGQSVDTNNSVFNSNFAPSASQLDSNEVDPVAEADVYIAYGRDAQAEEILKEALRTQPDRNAVRVKLLEIYANRKDPRSFEVLASELYGLTKGEGEDWQQAAGLGMSLDPNNPLYASGKLPEDVAAKVSLMTAPTQPLDESDLDDLIHATHSRPSLESPNTLLDAPYFGSTSTLAEEVQPGAADHVPVGASAEAAHDASAGLDFDLDGIDTEHVEMPDVVDHESATAADNKNDFGSIDFDFIKPTAPVEPPPDHAVHPDDAVAENPSMSVPAVPHSEFEIPRLPEVPMIAQDELPTPDTQAPVPAAASTPLDFDLSGITLELNPSESRQTSAYSADDIGAVGHPPDGLHAPDIPALDSHGVPESASSAPVEPLPEMLPDLMSHIPEEGDLELDASIDHEYSNSAEMATKLDLAVAYQEIGDKEGARELLDEVIGGGTPEQSEKAKSLLVKLG